MTILAVLGAPLNQSLKDCLESWQLLRVLNWGVILVRNFRVFTSKSLFASSLQAIFY